jgi:hypothetical protein
MHYASIIPFLVAALLLALAPAPAAAVSPPLQWRWLETKLPQAVRPLLTDTLNGLPQELCRVSLEEFAGIPFAFMDQVRAA